MPQTTNRQLVRDMNNMPVGPGTVYNAMLKISAATRERAKRANEGEKLRLGKVTRVMDRNQRVADNVQTKVLEKTHKQLKELQAFQVVLRDQYSIRNFRTLKTPPPCMSDRRRRLETMFYTSGFSQKSMQPEIRRQLRKTDPERMRRELKRHLLESSRQEAHRLDEMIKKSLHSHPKPVVHSLSDVVRPLHGAITVKHATHDTAAIHCVAEANQVLHVNAS